MTKLDSGSVDVVTCSGLFSYVGNPEALIWEMRRIAKQGSTVAVNFHTTYGYIANEKLSATSVHPRGVVHFTRYNRGMVTDMFEENGMKLQNEIINPKGLMRFADNSYVPLVTQRYRA